MIGIRTFITDVLYNGKLNVKDCDIKRNFFIERNKSEIGEGGGGGNQEPEPPVRQTSTGYSWYNTGALKTDMTYKKVYDWTGTLNYEYYKVEYYTDDNTVKRHITGHFGSVKIEESNETDTEKNNVFTIDGTNLSLTIIQGGKPEETTASGYSWSSNEFAVSEKLMEIAYDHTTPLTYAYFEVIYNLNNNKVIKINKRFETETTGELALNVNEFTGTTTNGGLKWRVVRQSEHSKTVYSWNSDEIDNTAKTITKPYDFTGQTEYTYYRLTVDGDEITNRTQINEKTTPLNGINLTENDKTISGKTANGGLVWKLVQNAPVTTSGYSWYNNTGNAVTQGEHKLGNVDADVAINKRYTYYLVKHTNDTNKYIVKTLERYDEETVLSEINTSTATKTYSGYTQNAGNTLIWSFTQSGAQMPKPSGVLLFAVNSNDVNTYDSTKIQGVISNYIESGNTGTSSTTALKYIYGDSNEYELKYSVVNEINDVDDNKNLTFTYGRDENVVICIEKTILSNTSLLFLSGVEDNETEEQTPINGDISINNTKYGNLSYVAYLIEDVGKNYNYKFKKVL